MVDKLTTGFDAPRNSASCTSPESSRTTSYYQPLPGSTGYYEGKDFGYVIDYAGVLQRKP